MNNFRNWFVGTATLVALSTAMLSACSSDNSGEATVSSKIEAMGNKVQEASQAAGDAVGSAAGTTTPSPARSIGQASS